MSSFRLHHPAGIDLSSQTLEADVAAVAASRRDMKTRYIWYDLPNAVIAGAEIAMSVCFYYGKPWGIRMAVVGAEFGTSWPDFSEAKERARTVATSEWLERIGFPAGRYEWGLVYAEFDAKGGSGGGGVRFG